MNLVSQQVLEKCPDLDTKEPSSGLDFINNSECDEDILIYWGQKA